MRDLHARHRNGLVECPLHGQTSSKSPEEPWENWAAYFHDQTAFRQMDSNTLLYEVQSYEPLPDGTEGGLFWGNTTLYPGTVGDEYFMTKGHFHRLRNRGEFYVTCKGQGALLLMEGRWPYRLGNNVARLRALHPGHHAHRVANTGNEPLVFIACWPSDAGYDYAAIERSGFSARLLRRDGVPTLVPQEITHACFDHRFRRLARQCRTRQRNRHRRAAYHPRHRAVLPRHAPATGNHGSTAISPACRSPGGSCRWHRLRFSRRGRLPHLPRAVHQCEI